MVARDRWGQPRVIPPGGDRLATYKRCTSFIDVLENRSQLEKWLQRMVAEGLTARPDLLAGIASAGGDKFVIDRLCEEAKNHAGASTKRDLGTALHSLTEQLDLGNAPYVPPASQPDIDAYLEATKGMKMVEVEVFVVNDDLRVGGTFDRVVEIDEVRYIADLKTGDIKYDEKKIAMQLAVYASGVRYEDSARSPLDVNTDRGLVIHLPSGTGTCTLYWSDLKAGWEGVRLAADVWEWRQRKGFIDSYVYEASTA